MCCCYLFGEYLCTQTSNIDGDVLLASPEKARRAESCTSLWNKLWKSVKELFWSVPPGVFSRLASAKVQTFLITKKPFPYFSYKKVDFYQKTAGYTLYNIYVLIKTMKHHIFRVERCSAVGVYRIMSAALDLYRTSFPPGFIRNGNDFCVISKKMPTFAQSIIIKL